MEACSHSVSATVCCLKAGTANKRYQTVSTRSAYKPGPGRGCCGRRRTAGGPCLVWQVTDRATGACPRSPSPVAPRASLAGLCCPTGPGPEGKPGSSDGNRVRNGFQENHGLQVGAQQAKVAAPRVWWGRRSSLSSKLVLGRRTGRVSEREAGARLPDPEVVTPAGETHVRQTVWEEWSFVRGRDSQPAARDRG